MQRRHRAGAVGDRQGLSLVPHAVDAVLEENAPNDRTAQVGSHEFIQETEKDRTPRDNMHVSIDTSIIQAVACKICLLWHNRSLVV